MNLPLNIDEVIDQINIIDTVQDDNPIWIITLQNSKYEFMYVYFSETFRNQLVNKKMNQKMNSDPKQLYKCLRNTQYGFDQNMCKSQYGHDGIYVIDLYGRYHNNMVKIMIKYDITSLYQKYPFLEKNSIPIRVVAHPNKIRIRPVGYVSLDNKIQHLVLVDIAVDKI